MDPTPKRRITEEGEKMRARKKGHKEKKKYPEGQNGKRIEKRKGID